MDQDYWIKNDLLNKEILEYWKREFDIDNGTIPLLEDILTIANYLENGKDFSFLHNNDMCMLGFTFGHTLYKNVLRYVKKKQLHSFFHKITGPKTSYLYRRG